MSLLPLRHLSIRVPWHDNGWTGTFCNHAKGNAACLALAEIRETRDDSHETALAGQSIEDLPQRQWPACIGERATIMAPFEFTREIKHPYASFSPEHSHITPAKFRHPAYSAGVIPFRWMSRSDAFDLARRHDLDVDFEREPMDGWLEHNNWIQDHENQRELLNAFFSAVEPERHRCKKSAQAAKKTPIAVAAAATSERDRDATTTVPLYDRVLTSSRKPKQQLSVMSE